MRVCVFGRPYTKLLMVVTSREGTGTEGGNWWGIESRWGG